MRNFNFFEMLWKHGRTLKRVGLVLVMCLLTITQAWGEKGFNTSGQWNIKYWNGGDSDKWGESSGGYGNDSYIDLGVQTLLNLKGSWVKTWSNGGWTQSEVCWYVGFTNESMTYQNKVNKSAVEGDQTWEGFGIDYNLISNAPVNPGPNTVYMYWRLDDYTSTSTSRILYTIPGFTTTSTSQTFDNTAVSSTNDKTISFGTHYGTALTTGNCSITGTNASEFSVRSINESGVTVRFAPTSAGEKSATLTITDAHSKTCTITLSGKTLHTLTYSNRNAHASHNTVPASPTTYAYGTSITVKDNTGLMWSATDGKVFAGWATTTDKADAGTVDYVPGLASGTFTLNSNVTLYPVWIKGSYLFQLKGSSTSSDINTTDFGAGNSKTNTAVEVNGVTFSKTYYKTAANQTNIKQQYQNPKNFIVYDTKSTTTTIRVYLKNTHTSSANLYYYLAKEGSTSETDQSISLSSGEAKVVNIDASSTKGARVIFSDNQYDKIFITQIIAIESGTTLPLPGQTDYELAFPGRVASHFLTINGIEVSGPQSNIKWNYGDELRLQSGSSKYVKFTTPASPSQMLLTTLSGKGGYVCTDKSSPSTTGVYFPSVSKTTEHKINLSASTTYYIMGETSSNTCISKIAFTDATTITYDANEGSGSMGSSKNIVSSNSFTPPSGKTFVNWNTKANGTGTPYAPGDYAYTDVKLYAQWGYALTYDKNTTDAVTNMPTSPVGVKAGSTNLASEVPVRSGYIFVGWQVGGSGTIYQQGASYTMPSSAVTMKAKWVAEDMYISNATPGTWGEDKSNGDEITSTHISGTISGGIVVYSGSGTMGCNSTAGLVFDNTNDQITVTLTGLQFVAGSVIVIDARGRDNTSSHTCGFTVSGIAPTPATVTSSEKWNAFRQLYTVTAEDALNGTSSFTLERKSTSEKVYLYSLYVGGCEELSCSATAPGSISKGSASGGTGTITLTAAGSAATNNTWYWQSAADGTATNLGSGATKDVSVTGTYYLRSYCSDNGGCWSDAVWVTVSAADLLTTPTATFSNSYYIIGGSSLNLSSLWTSDSEGSVTYSVQSAGGTGASISTAAFTATTAGTATVRASQAANGNYSAITKDATITVLPGYATSIDFEGIIDADESSSWKTTMEGRNYKLTQSNSSNWSMDDGTSGTKQADKGLKIKETGDNAGKIAFAVHANQTVELKVGTLAGTASGKASFSINGGASYSDITGASTASTGDPVTYTYKGNTDRVYVFKTKSSSWNILQHITIGYKVTYDKGTYGTGTVDPMYKTYGTGLTLSSSTFSRDGYDQDGWSTSDGGDKVYDLGGSYTSNAEITLYPHWTVACTDPGLAYATGSVTKTLCDGSFTNTLTNSHSVAVTYTSSNTSVATVASDGAITIKAAGSTTITASSIAQTVSAVDYCADEASYTLTVNASTAAGLSYSTSTVKKDVGDDAFTNTLTNSNSLTVTYTSSDESVATVASNGAVTIKAAGTTTITASSAQQKVSSTCYAAGEASYTLTVYPVYTVTYNPMGGTCGTESATTVTGDVTLPSATNSTYSLVWIESDGTEAGGAGDTYTPSGNVTLYAKWTGSCAGGGGGSTTLFAWTKGTGADISSDETSLDGSNMGTMSIGTSIVGRRLGSNDIKNDANGYKLGNNDVCIEIQGTSNFAAGDVVTITGRSNSTSESDYRCFSIAPSTALNARSSDTIQTNKRDNGYYGSDLEYTVAIQSTQAGAKLRIFRLDGKTMHVKAITVTRPSGGSSCYTVTYDGNGATSGYVNDPLQYAKDAGPTVKYNTNGYERTGYEFVGWNTAANGSGTPYAEGATITDIDDNVTLYAQWRVLISSDNTNFSGYASVTSADDVRVTNGATLTITTDELEIHDLIIDDGATLNVSTNSGSAITFTINSLHLKGGWNAGKTKYDMPRVYIDPKSSLSKSENTVNFDITVDQSNYYPIALPFDVAVNSVDYVNSSIASISTYGTHYAIKEYRGDLRAENGPDRQNNWKLVAAGSTLKAGKGYILSGLNVGGRAEIRFPLSFTDAWTTEGEQGTVSAVTKNVVAVTAHTGKATEGDKYANKGWNLLGVPFMSCYATGTDMGTSVVMQGKFNFDDGTWDGEDTHRYVNVPLHDFSEYVQVDMEDDDPVTVLRPGWCFFVQIGTTGSLTFLTTKQAEESELPIYAPKRTTGMPTVKTGIVLSGNGASDKTTLLISDKYNGAEYEINADLEKMFGNGYTLATYSLSNDTRLAYNAMSKSDAQLAIPIGYRAPAEGSYTFSINPRYAESGAFSRVDLIDYEVGTLTNLLMSDYTFSTERTQNDTRFAINVVLAPQVTTDIESVNGEGLEVDGVRKVLINNELYIVVDGKMFDATGKAVR